MLNLDSLGYFRLRSLCLLLRVGWDIIACRESIFDRHVVIDPYAVGYNSHELRRTRVMNI